VSIKLDKDEVKSPDQFLQGLEKVMAWIQKNIAIVGIIFAVLVIGGVAWSIWDNVSSSKEEKLLSELALPEKEYNEKKNKFKEGERQLEAKKKAEASKDKKDAANKDEKIEVATGDLQKDFGPYVEKFTELVNREPKSKAGQISAMYLAEMYTDYKQPEKALEVLNKVSGEKANDVISALILNLKAGLIADKGDCQAAVSIWENVTKEKKVAYLHDEAKLRMALCYEKMNDNSKAEQLYTELSKPSEDPEFDRAVSEDAKKYLRLLKVRTSGGT
jgi:predicted negative regulator of RcsB-dependent stress response